MPLLINVLKELELELRYQELKRYLQSMRRKRPLNGKDMFELKGSSTYLRRLQIDRRSRALGLIEIRPYDVREFEAGEQVQGDFLSWDRSVNLFDCGLTDLKLTNKI